MKKRFYKIGLVVLIIVFGAFSLISCNDKSEEGYTMEIKDGKLYISLDGNATTGYLWSYEIENDEIISCDSSEYVENEHESGMVGCGGQYRAVFSAQKDGTTKIVFSYKRNWEEDTALTKVFNLKVENGKISLINN